MNVNTTLHILLIEDNLGDTKLVSNMLKSSSIRYELYTVPTLFEGTVLIEQQEITIVPTFSDYITYTHPEDKEKVQNFFELAAKDGQLHHLTHRLVINGRSIKHISIQAKMNFDEIRQKLFLSGTLQDITRQKITEELIIEKNINTQASSVKDEALADISFHIRTPLSSVINLLFLMEKTEISPNQTELIDGLKTSVDDLSIMINNLMNFSILTSDKIEAERESFEIGVFMRKKFLKFTSQKRTKKRNKSLEWPSLVS